MKVGDKIFFFDNEDLKKGTVFSMLGDYTWVETKQGKRLLRTKRLMSAKQGCQKTLVFYGGR